MQTKKLYGNYYALRCVQTRSRADGDAINAWEDVQIYFDNNHAAEHQAMMWEKMAAPNHVYAFVGLKL